MIKNSLPHFYLFLTIFSSVFIFLIALNSTSNLLAITKITLANLKTEYKQNPIGIDILTPRLSWEIIANERAFLQTAWQIQTALKIEDLKKGKNLLWDSGKKQSDQSIHVEYQGPELNSCARVYWHVRVWDNNGKQSEWSEPAFWEMGLLHESDWTASWIHPNIEEDLTKAQPCPFVRNEFELKKKVKTARAYVTSLGMYELFMNGKHVGDQVLTPGWTSYNKRQQYQVYDVTDLLKSGKNAVGAILGDGWYRGHLTWDFRRNYYGEKLALLLQIQVTYEDGTSEIITSDKTWKAATGPILESDIYNGEIYDARLEMNGWNDISFNDKNWNAVNVIDHPKDILIASYGPPIRKTEEIKPIKIIKTPKGETVVDMGQNMVGWVRLKVKGTAGTTVKLVHAEVLDKQGNFYIENLRKAKQRVEYTLKGGNEEIYEPHFTFQGFRFVAVENYPGELTLESLTGIVVHSDLEPTGNFSCSDPLINQLQHNIQWGQKGNFVDVPTDCPQRDERLGWTGDAQVFSPTACYNMDAATFFTKWLKDLAADQFENGSVPHVIPDVLKAGGSAAWADASVIIPWTVYLSYGDKRILEQQYPSMKAWVEFMNNKAGENHLWLKGGHFGDWLAYATTGSDYPGATTEKDLIATAYFAHSTRILQQTAAILGKTDDAKHYDDLAEKIKKAFQDEFITPNGRVVSHTQTGYSLALAFDLYPESLKQKGAEYLADDVNKFKHITTGFVGAPLLCNVLSQCGQYDLAFMLLNRKEYPSWLYPITKGATTIWERWDGLKPDGSFQDAGMNSFNHYAYGAIGDWLYKNVAGINIDADKPGYKHIIIHPHVGGGLTEVNASHHSIFGDIKSAWKVDDKKFILDVTIPSNATATVVLPDTKIDQLKESGKKLKDAKGITKFVETGNDVTVELGSGQYSFEYLKK